MFDHHHVPLAAARELPDGARRRAALRDVEVRRGLVEEVDVGLLHEHQADGDALQLATAKLTELPGADDAEVECSAHGLEHSSVVLGAEQLGDALRRQMAREQVHQLGLGRRVHAWLGLRLGLGLGIELGFGLGSGCKG